MKPRYKRTSVGVIPEDWDVVQIGKLLKFKNGLNKAKQFFGHGTPIVNYLDVFGCPRLRYSAITGLVDVNAKELDAYDVRRGDVFFTRTSETVEEVGIASVMLDEPAKTVYSGFVLRARPVDKSLEDAFKAYCFAPRYFRKQVISRASYTTRALISGRSLSAAVMARPPKPEQRAIAAALSDVDDLLASLDRLIAKKRDLKQAAMQQLLTGQTRLPGFQGEWEVKPLGKLLRFQVGFPFSSAHFNQKGIGIRLVKNRDLKSDDQVSHYSGSFDQEFVVRNGDILVGMDGDFLPCWWNKGDALLNQRVGRLLPKAGLDAAFAFYALRKPLQAIEDITSSTTVKHLSHGDVESITQPFPELSEQVAIAAVLSDMDIELAILEARRDKTRALKQGMMQELLTGRTRLV